MPSPTDLKRLVRSRMSKTGEPYAAAQARILAGGASDPAEFATIAGMSDAAIQAKTGRTWVAWVRELDAVGATSMSHRDIARYVQDAYDVSGWWAQTITVAYERIRGLRETGQRRGGKFEANKSKTFAVPITRLYRAFSVKRTRSRWLGDVALKIRTSTVDKSMRMTWPDGTSVQAYFTDKGTAKSHVAIQHAGLADKLEVAQRKEFWEGRLAALGEMFDE